MLRMSSAGWKCSAAYRQRHDRVSRREFPLFWSQELTLVVGRRPRYRRDVLLEFVVCLVDIPVHGLMVERPMDPVEEAVFDQDARQQLFPHHPRVGHCPGHGDARLGQRIKDQREDGIRDGAVEEQATKRLLEERLRRTLLLEPILVHRREKIQRQERK